MAYTLITQTRETRYGHRAIEGMGLSKSEMAALPDKHPGNIYRELSRNSTGGVYTGSEAQRLSKGGRIARQAKNWVISGRLGALYSGQVRNVGLHIGRLPLFIR
jgi:IS30 family transposase